MAKFGEGGELLKCSFCGKSQKQVKKLIAGPGVYICDECIELCNDIIREEVQESGTSAQHDHLPQLGNAVVVDVHLRQVAKVVG